jgi:hypothetical protein
MKSYRQLQATIMIKQSVAVGVLFFVLVGIFHVIPSDYSNHTKLENHWASASPVLQIPFEEKDKEDSEDDLQEASSHPISAIGYATPLIQLNSYASCYSAGFVCKLPVFLSLRSIRI